MDQPRRSVSRLVLTLTHRASPRMCHQQHRLCGQPRHQHSTYHLLQDRQGHCSTNETQTPTSSLTLGLTSHVSSSSTGCVDSHGTSTAPAASCRTDKATGKASGNCAAKFLHGSRTVGTTEGQVGRIRSATWTSCPVRKHPLQDRQGHWEGRATAQQGSCTTAWQECHA
jgi:hypothetical protein